MDIRTALKQLLEFEGDYSDNAADPGGRTRFGITEAQAKAAGYLGDMRSLPLEVAESIYKKYYWDAVRADELPGRLRYAVFDAAVNSGPSQAAKWLQRALNVPADGAIGPQTIAAANKANPEDVRNSMLSQRLLFMARLPQWQVFGRGWANRIATILES